MSRSVIEAAMIVFTVTHESLLPAHHILRPPDPLLSTCLIEGMYTAGSLHASKLIDARLTLRDPWISCFHQSGHPIGH
jgi:hypothetical protein